MTIKGSLQGSIPIAKAFLTRNFSSNVEKWPKICGFGGEMGSKCKILFSGPPKGTSLRETASFDVLIVKIGVGVLAVGCRKNQKRKKN